MRERIQHADQLSDLRRRIHANVSGDDVAAQDVDDFVMCVHETVVAALGVDELVVDSDNEALVTWARRTSPDGSRSELVAEIRALSALPSRLDASSLRGQIVTVLTDVLTVTELIGGSVTHVRCLVRPPSPDDPGIGD